MSKTLGPLYTWVSKTKLSTVEIPLLDEKYGFRDWSFIDLAAAWSIPRGSKAFLGKYKGSKNLKSLRSLKILTLKSPQYL